MARYVIRKVRLANGRVVNRRVAMGGMFDVFDTAKAYATQAENAEQLKCIDQANLDARVRAIEAKQSELLAWNPLPTVTVTDLSIITTALKSAIAEAKATVMASPRTTGDADAQIRGSVRDLETWGDERIRAWEAAIATARATGANVISVTDLKSSVRKVLNHVSNAFMVRAFFECRVDALYRAAQVVDRIVNITKQVAGTVVEIGTKIVKAATAPLNVLAWLGKYPYIPIGIAAIVLFKRYGVKV